MGINRILNKNLFLYLLDLEVKRAWRYQNFISLLLLNLKQCPGDNPGNNNGSDFQTCYQILIDLLTVELRETDIIGSLGENKLGVLFPYADQSAGGHAKARFEGILKYYDFKNKGYEVETDQICFPVNGTAILGLIKGYSDQLS